MRSGKHAIMRRVCSELLTRPITKRSQCGAMPPPSAASSSERTSEHTVTEWPSPVRCRIMLKGRIFPPRLGGNGKR